MRSWKLTARAALLAGLLALFAAGVSSTATADEPGPSASGQTPARSTAPAEPALPPKSRTADPAKASVEPTDALLVFGGGLLLLALAAVGLTITFRSLLRDLRNRRNRYRRRAKREPRSN
jgi:hypothetical protein